MFNNKKPHEMTMTELNEWTHRIRTERNDFEKKKSKFKKKTPEDRLDDIAPRVKLTLNDGKLIIG